MEEIHTILAYENSHKIIQDRDEFSFSIDSTLLSFFADIRKRESRIIDLGCGNGFIPLLLSMRTNKKIIGVEIQENSYSRAKRSVELNGLSDQIDILHEDIKNLKNRFDSSSFSLVITNPPYFRVEDSNHKNDNEALMIARHEVKINMDELLSTASYLLSDGGEFVMVQRTERLIESLDTLRKYNLIPKRIRFVYPKEKKESYIFLIDARKAASTHGLKIEEPLYIYDKDGKYTKEIHEYFHFGEENEKIISN